MLDLVRLKRFKAVSAHLVALQIAEQKERWKPDEQHQPVAGLCPALRVQADAEGAGLPLGELNGQEKRADKLQDLQAALREVAAN